MAIFGTSKKGEKKEKRAAKKGAARSRTHAEGKAHEIIRAPWFSEKAILGTEQGVYVFAIPASATKADVAGAVKELYKVEPVKVRVANLPGRRVSKRSRAGKAVRARRRKAYVYLAAGDKIEFA